MGNGNLGLYNISLSTFEYSEKIPFFNNIQGDIPWMSNEEKRGEDGKDERRGEERRDRGEERGREEISEERWL